MHTIRRYKVGIMHCFELASYGLIISIIKLHYLTLCKYLCTSKYI
jgi:hypothetical protein